MSQMVAGNHARAERIAREIVKPLDVGDIESLVTADFNAEVYDELYTAVDSDYPEIQKQLDDLDQRIDALQDEEAKKLCGEYSKALRDLDWPHTMAWFHLGFAAALRLLGRKRP
jgi:hypothetical protein